MLTKSMLNYVDFYTHWQRTKKCNVPFILLHLVNLCSKMRVLLPGTIFGRPECYMCGSISSKEHFSALCISCPVKLNKLAFHWPIWLAKYTKGRIFINYNRKEVQWLSTDNPSLKEWQELLWKCFSLLTTCNTLPLFCPLLFFFFLKYFESTFGLYFSITIF